MARRIIPQKQRIFVGCEGQSEQSYVRLLSEYATADVYLDAVVLQPGGGDARALLEKAGSKCRERQKLYGQYGAGFLLLDTDKLGNNSVPDLERKALKIGMTLIWQKPSHEAFLLRHFPGCQHRQPADSASALQALRRQFATYDKGIPARQLQSRISLDMVRQAAVVTAGFDRLLAFIAPL